MAGFDIQHLMRQARKLEKAMADARASLDQVTVDAESGGGLVKVKMDGRCTVLKIEIDPKAIDPSDPELLGDLVTAAVNEALRNGQALLSSKLGEAMPPGLGGLLPGL